MREFFTPTIVIIGDGSAFRIPGSDLDFRWTKVGSFLKVLPRYRDDGNIDVEIYPEFSFLDGRGKRKAVKVEKLITRLTVKDGARIYVGGAISGKRNDYMAVFGQDFAKKDGSSSNTALDMYLTARALKSDGSHQNKSSRDDYSDPYGKIFRR